MNILVLLSPYIVREKETTSFSTCTIYNSSLSSSTTRTSEVTSTSSLSSESSMKLITMKHKKHDFSNNHYSHENNDCSSWSPSSLSSSRSTTHLDNSNNDEKHCNIHQKQTKQYLNYHQTTTSNHFYWYIVKILLFLLLVSRTHDVTGSVWEQKGCHIVGKCTLNTHTHPLSFLFIMLCLINVHL